MEVSLRAPCAGDNAASLAPRSRVGDGPAPPAPAADAREPPTVETATSTVVGPATDVADCDAATLSVSLSDQRLTTVPPSVFSVRAVRVRVLDLSRNRLTDVPAAIGTLTALTELNLSRNGLKRLPAELVQLQRLEKLDVSSNALGCSAGSLALEALAQLPALARLDLRHNNKIFDDSLSSHTKLISAQLPAVAEVIVSPRARFEERAHAADRDATLVESQICPHSTGTLRRRLALVFGDTTDPDQVERPELLRRLVTHYALHGPRIARKVVGSPVSEPICAALLLELERWAAQGVFERPSIKAQRYMILSGPTAFPNCGKIKARLAARKVAAHGGLWALARRAIEEVDPGFAAAYTAVAFTKNFEGSPHIDTQNTGPFYGLALGDFSAGGGALCVECSALEVAEVDTRGRLGRVDGRYPHWVAPYTGTRYSVIFYQAQGDQLPLGTAVFAGTPLVRDVLTYCRKEDRYYNCYDRKTNTYAPSE